MRGFVLLSLLALMGCAPGMGLSPPTVLYRTDDTIAVLFYSGAMFNKEDEAMSLISSHCNGKFQVTGRVVTWEQQTTIDAVCK